MQKEIRCGGMRCTAFHLLHEVIELLKEGSFSIDKEPSLFPSLSEKYILCFLIPLQGLFLTKTIPSFRILLCDKLFPLLNKKDRRVFDWNKGMIYLITFN